MRLMIVNLDVNVSQALGQMGRRLRASQATLKDAPFVDEHALELDGVASRLETEEVWIVQ
jgi:hypothetical protein